MIPPEMRPVLLVRQIRFCGVGVVIGMVAAFVGSTGLGLGIVALSLALLLALIVRFRRR